MADVKICDRCGGVALSDTIGAVAIINQLTNMPPGAPKLKELCRDCVASVHHWMETPPTTGRAQLGAQLAAEPYRDASTPPPDATAGQATCGMVTQYRGLPVRCTLALGHDLPAATRTPDVEYSEQHYNSRYGNRW